MSDLYNLTFVDKSELEDLLKVVKEFEQTHKHKIGEGTEDKIAQALEEVGYHIIRCPRGSRADLKGWDLFLEVGTRYYPIQCKSSQEKAHEFFSSNLTCITVWCAPHVGYGTQSLRNHISTSLRSNNLKVKKLKKEAKEVTKSCSVSDKPREYQVLHKDEPKIRGIIKKGNVTLSLN